MSKIIKKPLVTMNRRKLWWAKQLSFPKVPEAVRNELRGGSTVLVLCANPANAIDTALAAFTYPHWDAALEGADSTSGVTELLGEVSFGPYPKSWVKPIIEGTHILHVVALKGRRVYKPAGVVHS